MSLGHSDCIHYQRPPGAKPTADVEEFMQQCREAGTVKIINKIKKYQGDKEWKNIPASSQGGILVKTDDEGPANPVYKEGVFYVAIVE